MVCGVAGERAHGVVAVPLFVEPGLEALHRGRYRIRLDHEFLLYGISASSRPSLRGLADALGFGPFEIGRGLTDLSGYG
jgi:hypothetical protein